MADVAIRPSTKPPPWRDQRVLRVAGQVLFIVVLLVIAREVYLNLDFNLGRRRSLSFDFLDARAGFGIKEHVIDYGPNDSFRDAYLVGVTNAITIALVGIVLSTIVGLVVGVARLSPNWLLRKITQVYVEVFRNTPVAVQIVFWYVAVILAIARLSDSLSLFGLAFLSNRGAAVPAIRGGDDFGVWWFVLLAGVVAAVFARRWRTSVHDKTGQPHYRTLWTLGVLVGFGLIGYVALGDAFSVELPEVGERRYLGGMRMSPEFAGVLIGLVVYTGTFIGEIVRGSILAVTKGQKEAAEALGLKPGQQLRLVVLPQAMRIAIPAINNQYLNLWKNTSLAFLIGFPEIINVSNTIINQAGGVAIQVFSLYIVTYLLVSLLISFFMNILNRAVALKGARV